MFAFPLIILGFGTLYRAGHSLIAKDFVEATFVLLVATCVFFVVTLRGFRIYLTAYSLTAVWLAACASFVSGMAIMDSWL